MWRCPWGSVCSGQEWERVLGKALMLHHGTVGAEREILVCVHTIAVSIPIFFYILHTYMQTLYKGTINASVLLALLRENSLWHVGERVALLPFCCFLLPLARGGKKKTTTKGKAVCAAAGGSCCRAGAPCTKSSDAESGSPASSSEVGVMRWGCVLQPHLPKGGETHQAFEGSTAWPAVAPRSCRSCGALISLTSSVHRS